MFFFMARISEDKAREKARELLDEKGVDGYSVKVADGGDSNYTFLVDEEFVIKIERRESWKQKMLKEPVILDMLSGVNGFRIPEVIDTGEIDGLYYRILEFLEGSSLDSYSGGDNFHELPDSKRSRYAREMGETLARVHDSKSFEKFGDIKLDHGSIRLEENTWSAGLGELQEWWYKHLEEAGLEETVERVENALERFEDRLDRVDESRLLHMEFDLRNVLFHDDDKLAVLDWESASAGDPLLDVVVSSKRIAWIEKEDSLAEKSFREGYRSVRDIDIDPVLEDVYELVIMLRFLLILRNDSRKERIENRIEELLGRLSG